MANPVLQWDKRPDFLAYTDLTPIPGVTSYAVPRDGTGTDVTSFHPGQAFLSEENMPDIMYTLQPCVEWKRFRGSKRPEPKQHPDGSPMYEQWTRPGSSPQVLRDFKILPDKISTEEAWWYIEFVRRMDPRIGLRDILMRHEWTAERQRVTDVQYINSHINTPGYRKYRPAWKMIAWHARARIETDNASQTSVLDALTDAQKNANTTRGSTPGLIHPTLGEIPGNRIPLPDLPIPKKRGPRNGNGNADSNSNLPLMQPGQALPNVQATQAPPNSRAEVPQTPYDHWKHLSQRPSQGSSSNATIAPFPLASATTDSPAASFSRVLAASGYNGPQAHVDAQARDAAAMPPPPPPPNPQYGQYPHPRRFTFFPAMPSLPPPPGPRYSEYPHPQTFTFQGPARPLPQSTRPPAFVAEKVPEPPSEEDLAQMSARCDEAIAEIDWLSEPFLGTDADLSDILPIDLGPALVKDFDLDFMFPAQGKNAVPNPGEKQRFQNEAEHNPPNLPIQQGTKRKEHGEGNEYFEQVQLDERQVRRPVKRVRLLQGSNIRNNQGASNPNAASSPQQQWQRLTPRVGQYQSPYSQGQSFGGPTLRRTQPPSHPSVEQAILHTGGNPYQYRNGGIIEQARASYFDRQPSIGSPFVPTVGTGAQTPDVHPWDFLTSPPADTSSHGKYQAGQMLRHPSAMVPSGYTSQSPISQPAPMRPLSRADRGRPADTSFHNNLQAGQIMRRTPGMFPSGYTSQSPISQPTPMRPLSRADRGGPADTSFHNNLQAGQIMRRTPGMFPSGYTSQSPISQPTPMRPLSRADRGGPADTSFQNNLQAGQIMRPTSAMFPSGPTSQPPMPQLAATRPTSRADRGYTRENQENREGSYGYNPYAKSQ